jgi:hypothetical protein
MPKSVSYTVTMDGSGVNRGAAAANQSMSGLEAAANRVGTGLTTLGGRGSTALSSIASTAGSGLGLGPLQGIVSGLSGSIDILQSSFRGATGEGMKLSQVGGIATAVGAGVAAIGIELTHLAAPLARAEADLKGAFAGADASLVDYADQVDAVDKKMEHYGFTSDQTNEALARMTAASGDPTTALGEMDVALDIAARKGIGLAEAADMIDKAFAGNFKSFKSLGFALEDSKKAATEAETAATKLATANEKLATTTQSLSDFEARAAESMAAAREAWAQKLQTANDAVQSSDERVSDVQIRNAEAVAQRVTAAADAVRAAREAEMSASERLADLQERIADKAKPSIADQQALAKARGDVTKAQTELATGTGSLADRVQRLHDAEQNYADLQARQADANRMSLSERQELRHAEEAVAKAKGNTADAETKQQSATAITTSETSQLRDALEAQAKAHADLTKVQADGATAGEMTLSQQQEERRLRDAVSKAAADQSTAAQTAADAEAKAAATSNGIQQLNAFIRQRYAAQADEQADTTHGKLEALRAKVMDVAMRFGDRFGPALSAAGGVISVVGILAMAAGTGGLAVLGGAILPVIAVGAAIGLVALAIYEIYDKWDVLKERFMRGVEKLRDFGGNMIHGFADGISTAWSFVWDQITGFPSRLWDWASGAGEWLYTAGRNLLIGLWNGIASFSGELWDHLKSIAGDVMHYMTHPWEILSPSKAMARNGAYLMEGLAQGITARSGIAFVAASNASAGVSAALQVRPASALYAGATGGIVAGPGARAAAGAGSQELHLHFHDGAIQIDAGHVGTADSLVDQVHEGLQRKLRRTGDLRLTNTRLSG